ncbi:MAG TPA: M12 family metallo-peptidase [Thermoanaerobaculia bacterium]|jgi:predicted Zn-dependent protease|nr:M12 family metallo-peptidase [Thermoanaerobaculia bacterium]
MRRSRTPKFAVQIVNALLVFITMAITGFFLTSSANAADDLGFRFFTNNISVSECATSYQTDISAAVADYNNNTDLIMALVTNACTFVTYVQGDYGPVGWYGKAEPRNSTSRPCFNSDGSLSGLCNTTDFKAKTATIYLNSYNGGIPTSLRAVVTRHEMGHVFGLGHTSCSAGSIMRPGSCSSFYTALQAQDKNYINAWY